jgi:UDP-N-acetylglucosamine 2-epimerase (non-hydrolysing)
MESMVKPIVVIIGTRAEAIKLIPLYLEFLSQKLPTVLCATSQHLDLLQQAFKIFNITPDFNLNIMKKNQDLFYLTNAIMEKTKEVFVQINPALVVVQGDTTTTMGAALSAFYMRIPIAHVEAGLRTGNMSAPFPEEMNRKVVGQIASYHFAPTAFSTANLLAEGVKRENVFCTGNTIVDALLAIKKKLESKQIPIDPTIKKHVDECKKRNDKLVLLTAHRRESFNGGLLRVFRAIKSFSQQHPDVTTLFPVHPNPNVLKAVEDAELKKEKNIVLLAPLSYSDLVYLLTQVNWVASDSGGIQEEAVSLGKKILVLRDATERCEGVWEGTEILVGTNEDKILYNMEKLYTEKEPQGTPSYVYGDGNACKRIATIIKSKLNENEEDIDRRTWLYRPTDSTHCSE